MESNNLYSLYWEIEKLANIKGNSHYIIGDQTALYKFEPGTSEVPHEITINYNENIDLAKIGLKISNIKFLKDLEKKLANTKITRLHDEKSNEWIKYDLKLNKFSQNYIVFAKSLSELLQKNRFYMPKLVNAKFEEDGGNDEYSASYDNGQIWIRGYVCHGAEYNVQIAGYDLSDIATPKDLAEYANALVKIEHNLNNNKFNFEIENDGGHIDFQIKAKAESEDKIRKDLESIVEIVSK